MIESEPTIPQDELDANENYINPDSDWFKIHRSVYKGQLYGRRDLQALWFLLISEATWKTHKRGAKTYKRGVYYFGLVRLAGILGYGDHRPLKAALNELVDLQHIKMEKTKFKSRDVFEITICNYSNYQGGGSKTDAKPPDGKALKKRSKSVENAYPKEGNKVTSKELKNSILPGGSPGSAVWTSYSSAYAQRYGTSPTRNAKSNSLCAQFAKRVPHEDAPLVIAFYLTHGDRWYVQKCHALEYAVKDAEKLHMEWKNGCQMTGVMATSLERQSTNDQVIADHLRRKYGK